MLVIVLDLATTDDETTEAALRRSGYSPRTVWVKEAGGVGRDESMREGEREGRIVRALGVGRYAVTDTYGRGAD